MKFKPFSIKNEKTHVMILATIHLESSRDVIQSKIGKFPKEAFKPLIDLLEKFNPDFIGIEIAHPKEIARLINEDYEEAKRIFGYIISNAKTIQEILRVNWIEAYEKAKKLPKKNIEERIKAILFFIASYDWYSALLQWSYISENYKDKIKEIPEEIKKDLENKSKYNEISLIAIPLAKKLNHQMLYPIDSLVNDLPENYKIEEFLEYFKKDKNIKEYLNKTKKEIELENKEFLEYANKGNVLPFYLKINSKDFLEKTLHQWKIFFETKWKSGIDRARVAMWEVRNSYIAANIREITASKPGSNMITIIGASHKIFLDFYLRNFIDIEIVNLEDLMN